jgi:hypothetical protein
LLPPVALASCRQMPPGRRRYIVHPVSRHYITFALYSSTARRARSKPALSGSKGSGAATASPFRVGNVARRGRGHSREHPYPTAARHTGIYPEAGTRLRPPPRCSERRSPAQSCQRLTAINSQFLVETSRLSPVFLVRVADITHRCLRHPRGTTSAAFCSLRFVGLDLRGVPLNKAIIEKA